MFGEYGTLREFAEAYTAAWCSQDAARVAAFYSPDGSLTINNGAPAIGRAAIQKSTQGFMTAFPDMKVVMEELNEGDGDPVYHWMLSGTNSGPGGAGRSVRISGFEAWQTGEDGLIAVSKGHFDAEEYQRQLDAK